MENINPISFHNWLPLKLKKIDHKLYIEWGDMGNVQFTKPFFDETLSIIKYQNLIPPYRKRKITPLMFLIDVAKSIELIKPTLFIYHTSRCGSTLISQLLSLDKANIVVSEYCIIDGILRINEKRKEVSPKIRIELLKSIIAIVGQKRDKMQQRLIIKLDSWHFIYFNEIKKLFPTSNSIILFRDPDSILKSISKKPGIQFIPELVSPNIYKLENLQGKVFNPKKYNNLVLEKMYDFIEQITRLNEGVLALNYNNKMEKNMDLIIKLLEMDLNFNKKQEFKQRIKFHSKNPSGIFTKETIAHNDLTDNNTRIAFKNITAIKREHS